MFPFGAISAVHTSMRLKREREDRARRNRYHEEQEAKIKSEALKEEKKNPPPIVEAKQTETKAVSGLSAEEERKYYLMQVEIISSLVTPQERREYRERLMKEYDLKQLKK